MGDRKWEVPRKTVKSSSAQKLKTADTLVHNPFGVLPSETVPELKRLATTRAVSTLPPPRCFEEISYPLFVPGTTKPITKADLVPNRRLCMDTREIVLEKTQASKCVDAEIASQTQLAAEFSARMKNLAPHRSYTFVNESASSMDSASAEPFARKFITRGDMRRSAIAIRTCRSMMYGRGDSLGEYLPIVWKMLSFAVLSRYPTQPRGERLCGISTIFAQWHFSSSER